MRSSTLQTMLEMQDQKSLRWIEVTYLEAATEQLMECRRTLKYTYVVTRYENFFCVKIVVCVLYEGRSGKDTF